LSNQLLLRKQITKESGTKKRNATAALTAIRLHGTDENPILIFHCAFLLLSAAFNSNPVLRAVAARKNIVRTKEVSGYHDDLTVLAQLRSDTRQQTTSTDQRSAASVSCAMATRNYLRHCILKQPNSMTDFCKSSLIPSSHVRLGLRRDVTVFKLKML
jgi:hypothetical protein